MRILTLSELWIENVVIVRATSDLTTRDDIEHNAITDKFVKQSFQGKKT